MSWLRMLVFLAVISLLGVGVHLYLHHRLVRGPAWPAPWGAILTWSLIALGSIVPISFVVSRLAPRAVASPLSWVAFIWMGCTFFLLLLLLPSELVRIGDWLMHRSEAIASPERRQFLSRSIAGVVGVASVGLG
ncbi:MAG: hypothetical protein H6719_38625, partial [Sandaracinaceae bacterium]|nr:hypothetical protein [Sandaracinaceae bacterium]